MNDKLSRELAVFAAAVGLRGEEQAAYLARECGGDHALKARVEALLRDDSEAGNFMEQPPRDFPAANSNVIGEKAGNPPTRGNFSVAMRQKINSDTAADVRKVSELVAPEVLVEQYAMDKQGYWPGTGFDVADAPRRGFDVSNS